jgi:hypothetical protein
MKFTRVSDWAEVSECNGYSVCAAQVMGRYKFQAWCIPLTLLGTHYDAEACRQLCREHKAAESRKVA